MTPFMRKYYLDMNIASLPVAFLKFAAEIDQRFEVVLVALDSIRQARENLNAVRFGFDIVAEETRAHNYQSIENAENEILEVAEALITLWDETK